MANKVKISKEQLNSVISGLSNSFNFTCVETDFIWNEKDGNVANVD